jgi:hypothetical protein
MRLTEVIAELMVSPTKVFKIAGEEIDSREEVFFVTTKGYTESIFMVSDCLEDENGLDISLMINKTTTGYEYDYIGKKDSLYWRDKYGIE